VEDAHRGSLALEPTDKGACFVIRIPLAEPAA
jgi:signal transduction histidine kinase